MVTVFVLEIPDYESAVFIYFYIFIHTHTHTHTHTHRRAREPLAHLETRRLWRGIMTHNFAVRFARCSLTVIFIFSVR